MTVNVPVPREPLVPAPSARLERQVAAEHTMVRAVILGIFLALPFTVAITIGLIGVAISDKEPWYVWVGLGAGIGTYAAGFFGTCAGVMLSSHRFDELDEEASHELDHPTDTPSQSDAPAPYTAQG